MPSIAITRKHSKPIADGKKAINRLAKAIAERFDVEYGWEGNTLHFERSGVNGRIALGKGTIEVHAELSFLLTPIKTAIEREIERQLDKEFG
jgi:putative polyhydroxyalkanoate system protein